MKNINKTLLEQFNIGFEFEFYVKKTAMLKTLKEPKIPQEILAKYGDYFDPKKIKTAHISHISYQEAGSFFIKTLKQMHPEENWSNNFKIEEDDSLSDDQTKVGVEIILKHLNGVDAQRKLMKICETLRDSCFLTNASCGLHVNVSFKDKTKNTSDLAFGLTKLIETDKIKNKFGRKNNNYCLDNKKTDIEWDDIFGYDSSKIEQLFGKNNSLEETVTYLANLKKPANMVKFINMVESMLNEYCLDLWKDNRPAITPKKSSSGNYIEFRATGGKDYQHKQDIILDTINEYLKSMNTVNQLKNKNMVSSTTKKIAKI